MFIINTAAVKLRVVEKKLTTEQRKTDQDVTQVAELQAETDIYLQRISLKDGKLG